jgi:hypothetical protein
MHRVLGLMWTAETLITKLGPPDDFGFDALGMMREIVREASSGNYLGSSLSLPALDEYCCCKDSTRQHQKWPAMRVWDRNKSGFGFVILFC